MKTESEKTKVNKLEKRLEELNGKMVEILDQVCSILKIGRLPGSLLAGRKSLKMADRRLDHLRALRTEAMELTEARDKVLRQIGCWTPDYWSEFWQSLEGSIS